MALNDILKKQPGFSPFSRPPPVSIKVIGTAEKNKVLKWSFKDGGCTAEVFKINKICAISDGISVTKVTLMEELSSKLQIGKSYVIRNYTLMDQQFGLVITIRKDTMLFHTAPVVVSPQLEEQALQLLKPASPVMEIKDQVTGRFISLEGRVVEVSSVTILKGPKDEFPLQKVTLEQEGHRVVVSLWREATLLSLPLNETVRVSHVKGSSNAYGYAVQSTGYTTVEKMKEEKRERQLQVLGVMEESKTRLSILLTDDSVLSVERDLWEGVVGMELPMVPYPISANIKGGIIIGLEAPNAAE